MNAADPRAAQAAHVASLAQLACVLEASAPKPGNVSPGRPFENLRYEDFVISALAIGRAFEGVAHQSIGQTVRLAIESTREWTATNTNLGIVLLLAPLASAVNGVGGHFWRTPSQTRDCPPKVTSDPIDRARVRERLEQTTVEDARDVYAAIRLARPGGLGNAGAQDVADEPTMTLLEVMRLAADRDSIANEYASGFELTFTMGTPTLERARRDGLHWDDAIVETFLTLLAHTPDTHIVRRTGTAAAEQVSQLARDALSRGGVRSPDGRRAIDDMDRSMRDARHSLNPGTTADLTTAAIFVVLLGGCWSGSA